MTKILSEKQQSILSRPNIQALVKALDLVPVIAEPDLNSVKIAARVSDWFLEFNDTLLHQAQITPVVTGSMGNPKT